MRQGKTLVVSFLMLAATLSASAQWLLVPMDKAQTDHLKAYGLTFWALQTPREYHAEWLLNYRSGAFVLEDRRDVRAQALAMGVAVEAMDDPKLLAIKSVMEDGNMDTVTLEKAPKIAVYAPPEETVFQDPWDDAVKLALDYAEIPYDTVWDEQVLNGTLQREHYDWLHLHHEDFTGQHGKFYGFYKDVLWYRQRVALFDQESERLGFKRVPDAKGAVALAIRDYIENDGGFVFAMCSAPETMDIALAARAGQVDIVAAELDGSPIDPDYAAKLDFTRTTAFKNFTLITDPYTYEFSDIDNPNPERREESGAEDFTLFEFSAKYDPIPTMLTQCHVSRVHGYLGQSTSFKRSLLRDHVTVLGDIRGSDYVKYVHGKLGKGTFTFMAGHDPEDYAHNVGEPATQLELFKNSPGYRLILNNVLFPAAK
ncbi:MAG: asparagine synthetase B, partial [Candidatus Poribacteria bacterium]|nr:asparagine synthetase B [Candidatus Poribacteria bacterium]